MRWVLFLSKLAFISNLFFLLSFSLKLYDWVREENISSTIIIIGYVLAALLNPFANISYLVLFFFRRTKLLVIPGWLIVANIVFLILQLIYIILLNNGNSSLQ